MLGGARAQAPNAAAAGSRAGWSRRGRAAHCSPSPSLGLHTRSPAAASPWLGPEARTKRLSGGSAGARFYLQLEPQASRWFAGASRVPRTACARSTYSTQ